MIYCKLFILLFLSVGYLSAQTPTQLGVICCYDYKESISLEDSTLITDQSKDAFHLCQITIDKHSTSIDEKSFFTDFTAFEEKKNMLLYIHGDGADFNELIERGQQFPHLYDTETFFFAWPSLQYDENKVRNYIRSKAMIPLCFDRFLLTVDSLQYIAEKRGIKLSLFFHSLGNLFAKRLAHYILTHPDCHLQLDNIILNAPCVWEQDHYFWVDALGLICKGDVIITHNQKDKVLKAAAVFIEQQSLLGRPESFKNWGLIAQYVDFTDALDFIDSHSRFTISHTYFLEEPPVQSLYIKDFFYNVCNGIPLSPSFLGLVQDKSWKNRFSIPSYQQSQ